MTIQQLIFKSLNISRVSGVPCLYLSNPGVGKTTIIYNYAEMHNYKITELRGSTSSPEDILGYFVNEGKDYLQVKYPEWFIKILEDGKKSIPHLLFLDELTTVSRQVQASLLKLIFDREIHGRKLPADTLIVAAGNYNSNLAHGFGLISPVLNRFCIINLHADKNTYVDYIYNKINVQQEFIFPVELKKIQEDKLLDTLAIYLKMILDKYSKSKGDNLSIINLNNTDFSAVDNVDGEIFGILSPRTCSYLSKMVVAAKKLGYEDNNNFIPLGLIGFGTGEVTEYQYLLGYHKEICDKLNKILKYGEINCVDMEIHQLHNSIEKLNNLLKDIEKMSCIDYIISITDVKESVINLDNKLGYKNIINDDVVKKELYNLASSLLNISLLISGIDKKSSIFKNKIDGRNITIHNNIMDVIVKIVRGNNIHPLIKNNHEMRDVFKHKSLMIK